MKRTFGVRVMEGWMRLHGLLPLGYHRWWGRVLGGLMRSVFHYRYDVVMTNLSRSFPEKDYEEIRTICKQFYTHLGTIFTTMLWFGACTGKKGRKRLIKSHIVEITNPEELGRMVDKSTQAIVLHTHMGNWELLSGLGQYGYTHPFPLTATEVGITYKKLHSKFWDTIVADNRQAPVKDVPGMEGYIESRDVVRRVLSGRGKRYIYLFNTDQFPYEASAKNMPITFMHQPTATMTAAAGLAKKLGIGVVYLRYFCREDGGYTITFVPITDNAAETSVEAIMTRYYELLEADLRVQPWNYLWTHKRWK